MEEPTLEKPPFIDEEPSISRLLNLLITKIDKNQQRIQVKITRKHCEELFKFNEQNTQDLWSRFKLLQTKYGVIDIRYAPSSRNKEAYENAVIRLNRSQESLVRRWLNRTIGSTYKEMWDNACAQYATQFGDKIEHLISSPIKVECKAPTDILDGFLSTCSELTNTSEPITLRALSARSFWGDSKFLDNREPLLSKLFPTLEHRIAPRQLMLSACISNPTDSVLFIENQDTFLFLVKHKQHLPKLRNTTLIYSSGYRATAKNIRQPGHSILSTLQSSNPTQNDRFLNWWYNKNDQSIECYFWGDLDFSAMGILKALRSSFHNTQAWQPGYSILLEHANNNNGHGLTETNKNQQIDVGETGCTFADQILLPFMREHLLLVDQETVDLENLERALLD